jgi:hypothetical protein
MHRSARPGRAVIHAWVNINKWTSSSLPAQLGHMSCHLWLQLDGVGRSKSFRLSKPRFDQALKSSDHMTEPAAIDILADPPSTADRSTCSDKVQRTVASPIRFADPHRSVTRLPIIYMQSWIAASRHEGFATVHVLAISIPPICRRRTRQDHPSGRATATVVRSVDGPHEYLIPLSRKKIQPFPLDCAWPDAIAVW